MWAFITGMSWCLAGFSSVKLLCARPPPLPLPTLYFWEGNHYAALIPKEGEVMFCLFEGGVFPVIIWNSAWEIGLVSPIIYAIIYLYQYELMAIHFILLCYNPVLLSLLFCLECSSFGNWECSHLAPASLWLTPVMVCVCLLEHCLTFLL